jgi:hypothetical protein
MATFPALNFEVQVIAAFVIFVFGYVALFSSLMIFLFLAKGLYESAKAVRAYAVRYGSTNHFQLIRHRNPGSSTEALRYSVLEAETSRGDEK